MPLRDAVFEQPVEEHGQHRNTLNRYWPSICHSIKLSNLPKWRLAAKLLHDAQRYSADELASIFTFLAFGPLQLTNGNLIKNFYQRVRRTGAPSTTLLRGQLAGNSVSILVDLLCNKISVQAVTRLTGRRILFAFWWPLSLVCRHGREL